MSSASENPRGDPVNPPEPSVPDEAMKGFTGNRVSPPVNAGFEVRSIVEDDEWVWTDSPADIER